MSLPASDKDEDSNPDRKHHQPNQPTPKEALGWLDNEVGERTGRKSTAQFYEGEHKNMRKEKVTGPTIKRKEGGRGV